MRKLKMFWIPVLLGVLLVATVVGVANARPNARPLQQPWRVLTVGSHACIPADDVANWDHNNNYLECDSGWCFFYCPLSFPAAGEQAVGAINVKRLTMYVFDNDGTGQDSETSLRTTYPATGGGASMAYVSTFGSDTSDPQVQIDSTIQGNPIYRTQSPYLLVGIENSTLIRMYGWFVHYTW